MMNPNKSLPAVNSDSTRLSSKLAGLFGFSLVAFFIVFFAYDLLSSFVESSAARATVNEQTTPIVIDPRIANDLAKVLSLDSSPNSEDVKDPFSDRGGLSGSVSASASAGAQQSKATATSGLAASSDTRGSVASGNKAGNVANAPTSSPVESTKQRYDTWLSQTGVNGDVPLDPRLFAIEDLLPVGIVDGGNGQQEVMFFSEAAGKTLSFPLGTMFFDGWLAELRPEGVVFGSNDDRRTVRMRSWARSIRNAG